MKSLTKKQDILIENIINNANSHSDDATQMLTLLIRDVSYLSDEVIQKLIVNLLNHCFDKFTSKI